MIINGEFEWVQGEKKSHRVVRFCGWGALMWCHLVCRALHGINAGFRRSVHIESSGVAFEYGVKGCEYLQEGVLHHLEIVMLLLIQILNFKS